MVNYMCNTQGCAKDHIVYYKEYDGSEPPDCSGCGEPCEHWADTVEDTEPEIARMPDDMVESAANIIASAVWVRESVSQLWDRASQYSALPDEGVNRIVLSVVQKVLALQGGTNDIPA